MEDAFVVTVGELIGRNVGATLTPELAEGLSRAILHAYCDSLPPEPEERYLADDIAPQPHKSGHYFIAFRMDEYLDFLADLHVKHWEETEGYRHAAVLLPDYESFRRDEANGQMVFFGVIDEHAVLVGNCALYIHRSRHTGELVATEDTLYFLPEHRKPGLAKAFVKYMESALIELGVREVRVDSKSVNHVDRFMRMCGYQAVATRLVKRLEGETNVQ